MLRGLGRRVFLLMALWGCVTCAVILNGCSAPVHVQVGPGAKEMAVVTNVPKAADAAINTSAKVANFGLETAGKIIRFTVNDVLIPSVKATVNFTIDCAKPKKIPRR